MSDSVNTETTATAPKARKARAKSAPKAKKAVKAKATDRSKVIAATWQDKKVAKARAQRHGCKVGNKQYTSVSEAFKDLNLPMGRHILFRGKLKQVGVGKSLDFEQEGKKAIRFTLIERPEAAA